MTKKPYMPFFPDAYMSDTVHLTMEEQGAYFRLLCWMWINDGKLENDDKKIARILNTHPNKWQKLRPSVVAYFTPCGPGYVTQNRLQKEYQRANKSTPNITPDTPEEETSRTLKIQHMGRGIYDINLDGYEAAIARDAADAPTDHSNPNPKSKWINKEEMALAMYCGKRIDPLLTSEESAAFTSELFRNFTSRNLPMPYDFDIVANWLRKGADPQRDVLPVINCILSEIVRKQYPAPHSWKYFGKAVFTSVRERKR